MSENDIRTLMGAAASDAPARDFSTPVIASAAAARTRRRRAWYGVGALGAAAAVTVVATVSMGLLGNDSPGAPVAIGALAVALSRRPEPVAVPTPVTVPTVVTAPVVRGVTAPVVAAPVVAAPVVAAPAPRRQPAAEAEDPMLAELRAVQAAQRALARNDGAGALRALAALDRTHPRGNLLEERQAARVLALCAAGRAEDSRAAADRFLAQHPGSPQVARVRGACR